MPSEAVTTERAGKITLFLFLFLTGEGAVDPNDPNKENTLNQLSKTEISLSLTSKYDVKDGEAVDGRSLMIK